MIARANSARQPRWLEDHRVLERSDTVLWTLAPPGIVLHNFARRLYIELDDVGYRVWAYLDGARTIDEVVARCCAEQTGSARSRRGLARRITQVIDTLFENGFIAERTV